MVNVYKNPIVPQSLENEKKKLSGTYRCRDVVAQVYKDFNGKCYLCEDNNITAINVEHFKPHRKDRELKFDWYNLFYCCSHCNSTKGDIVQYDNILDCTSPIFSILDLIKLKIDAIPRSYVEVEALSNDEAVINTEHLLNKIYNATSPDIRQIESAELRKRIIREVVKFTKLLFLYDDITLSPEDKLDNEKKIIRCLSEKSPFTAFKVWIIKSKPDWFKEFYKYIPTLDSIYPHT